MSKIKLTISILAILFIVLFSMPAFAGSEIKFVPSTTIPGSDFVAGNQNFYINSGSLGQYIVAIYNYGIGLVSVLAVVMIMFGGYKWIFAAGNPSSIGDAKSTIFSALIGLALALGSFMLLNTINPALTTFKPLYLPEPKIGSCPLEVRKCSDFDNFFKHIKDKNKNNSSKYLDAIDFYMKKFGYLKDGENKYVKDKKYLDVDGLQSLMCGDNDMQVSCSIYPGLCYVDVNDFCKSIIDKECTNNNDCNSSVSSAICVKAPIDSKGTCQLGVNNSKCISYDHCQSGYKCTTAASSDVSGLGIGVCTNGVAESPCTNLWANNPFCNSGLSCFDDKKCHVLLGLGEECDIDEECALGLTCKDNDGLFTGNSCQ